MRPNCCVDCSGLAPLFMVRDIVWASAGMDRDGGWLCQSCLQHRLGRTLTREDYADCDGTRRYLRSIGRDDIRSWLMFGDGGLRVGPHGGSVSFASAETSQRVLDFLAGHDAEISLRDLGDAVGIGMNTAHCAVRRLLSDGRLRVARKGTGNGYPTRYEVSG